MGTRLAGLITSSVQNGAALVAGKQQPCQAAISGSAREVAVFYLRGSENNRGYPLSLHNYDDGVVQRGDIPSRPSGTASECVFGGLIPMHSGGQPAGPRQ